MQSRIQLVRNATLVFHYAGKKFLIDPMLAEKGRYPGFPATMRSELRNPLTEMPVAIHKLTEAVDAVIVSHLHPDHWDEVAIKELPKELPVYTQNQADAAVISSQGFEKVQSLDEIKTIEGVNITKTECQHGTDVAYSIPEVGERLGQSSGFYVQHETEKSIYFLGDTIWIDAVEQNLKQWQPDYVVVNAGYASMEDERLGAIIMGKEDILRIHQLLPQATIIAIHMEAVNHCILSRKELRTYSIEHGMEQQVLIPEDGEEICI